MSCQRAREIMARKAAREVSGREQRRLNAHIAACPECAGLDEQLERTWNALGCHPSVEPSPKFLPTLRARIAEDRRRGHWNNWRPALRWQVGALAVFTLGIAVFLTRAALDRHNTLSAPQVISAPDNHDRWDEQFLQDLDETLQYSAADSLSAFDSWPGTTPESTESETARPKPDHGIMKKEPA